MPRLRTFLLLPAVFLVLGTAPAAAATRYVDDTGVNAGDCTAAAAPCLTLQYAVTAAGAGDTVRLAPGTYAAGAVVDKAGLTIAGAGKAETRIGTTAALPRALDLRGGADDLTVRDLTLAGPFTGSGTIADRSGLNVNATAGLDVAGLRVEDVAMTGFKYAIDVRYPGSATNWTLDGVDTRINEYGARFVGATTGLRITRSHFDYANSGLYVSAPGTSPRTPGVFRDVEISATTFDGNGLKGIYLEQADALDVHDISAVTPPGPWPRADVNPDNAIDVNLKYGSFAGVRIADAALAGSTGAGLVVKGRNDAPSYSAVPGRLSGVTLEGLDVSGNAGGGVIVSTAVTNASLSRSRIVGNGTQYGLVNWSDAAPGASVAATGNWWGCSAGPTADRSTPCSTVIGDATAAPWLVLRATGTPAALAAGGATATVTASLASGSDGVAAPAPPDGPTAAFATDLGSLSVASAPLAGGAAQTVLTSGAAAGTAHVTATVDGEQATAALDVVGAPVLLEAPAVTGPAEVGGELACSLGTWDGAGLLHARRWTRDGTDIPGATGATHATAGADVGHTVGCVVHPRTFHRPPGRGAARARSGCGAPTLERLEAQGRVLTGEFRPTGVGDEWCDAEVLRRLRRRSLAKLRHEIEPVEPVALARFSAAWQQVSAAGRGLRGIDGVLRAVEQLAGAPVPASALEPLVLASRVRDYEPAYLDELTAVGEVVWAGHAPLPGSDGWVSLHLADQAPLTLPDPQTPVDDELQRQVLAALAPGGAWFFRQLSDSVGSLDDGAQCRAVGAGLVGAGQQRHPRPAPLAHPLRPAGPPQSPGRPATRPGRPLRPAGDGRPVGAAAGDRHRPHPPGPCHRGATARPARRRHPRRRRQRTGARGVRRASTACCRHSRSPAGAAAATSSRASAQPSSALPAPSTGCAPSPRSPSTTSRSPSRSRPPTRPTPTAPRSPGRPRQARPTRGRADTGRAARPARSSSSSTARSRSTSSAGAAPCSPGATSPSCSDRLRRRSRPPYDVAPSAG